jgi:hypothetical protein
MFSHRFITLIPEVTVRCGRLLANGPGSRNDAEHRSSLEVRVTVTARDCASLSGKEYSDSFSTRQRKKLQIRMRSDATKIMASGPHRVQA